MDQTNIGGFQLYKHIWSIKQNPYEIKGSWSRISYLFGKANQCVLRVEKEERMHQEREEKDSVGEIQNDKLNITLLCRT